VDSIITRLAAWLLLPLACPAGASGNVAPMSLLNGHIEVHTDSPHDGVTAANDTYKHSQDYNIAQGDGLGRGIDGHVHDYDTLNGVTYVDLFRLEPRRGLAGLAPEYRGAAPCSTATNEIGVEIDGKCLAAIEGELNRAYDTLQTDANGNPEAAGASEVYAAGSVALLDPNQKFIVVLANADRSSAGTLQIGCRTWPVVTYQDMITTQLENRTAPAALVDTVHGGGLVFTLAGILADDPADCPAGADAVQRGLGSTPTLRVGFGRRAILDGGIHATRAACVLGVHDYREKLCYTDRATLSAAEAALAAFQTGTETPQPYDSCNGADPQSPPPLDYLRDPADNLHITAVPGTEGSGYRWRNGALTVQLLKVDTSTGNAAYTLQPVTNGQSGAGRINYLPVAAGPGGARIGGTFARAFTVAKINNRNVVTADDTTKGADESGLLYEASIYWHYSEPGDEFRHAPPADSPCYGDINYPGAVLQQLDGISLSEYDSLISPLSAAVISRYTTLVCQVSNAKTEADLKTALLPLAELLDANPDLAKYHRYRDYAPGHFPESYLLAIDKGLLAADYDGDGLVGICETDSDNDGLSDTLESSIGTNPLNTDTDGDGLSDYEEVAWDADASSYDPVEDLNPLSIDTDGDWLSDFDEVNSAGTNPLNRDTDGDGFRDGTEAAAGYDPKSQTDFPVWGDINNDREVNTADVLLAHRAMLGLVMLETDQLARGNVAPLVNGVPDSPPDDAFNLADLLLIIRKAVHAVSY
jgi:hypothetical protein